MEEIKRILKGALIWFLTTSVMYIFFYPTYPTGVKKPIFVSLFVFIFPIYCAVRFSKVKLNIDWAQRQRPQPKTKPAKPGQAKRAPTQSAKPATRHVAMSSIDKMDGHDFEQFTSALLRKLGYERVEVTPGSGDQGVDVIAVKDGKRYAIQCKRYSKKLGNKPVQEVFAGKTIYGCSVAVVLTNNYFTEGAKEAAKATGVELWDRDTLRRMMDYANFKDLV